MTTNTIEQNATATTDATETDAKLAAQHAAEQEAARLVQSIEDARVSFEVAVQTLRDSCKKLATEGAGSEGDIVKDVRSVNNALFFTLQQQEKAREAGIARFGAGGQGQLALDDARSGIGLRRACLRDRGGDG